MKVQRGVFGATVCLMLCISLLMSAESWAEEPDRPWVSRVISIQGHVRVKRQGAGDWRPVGLDDPLYAGDQIRVEANSRAGVVLSNDAVLRLDQDTTLVFTEIEPPATFIFRLLKGAADFFSHRPRSLKIITPFVNGVVEGTEFFVQVDAQQTRIDLFEGRILAQNTHGELLLNKGQGAVAQAGQAPRVRILVHPRDSVQWALYYPPVLAVDTEAAVAGFSESLGLYNQGRPTEALHRLEITAQEDRNAGFYTLRAGMLLNVGRVDLAREDIRQALALDAADSDAIALQAVIAVVQNRNDEALAAARKAVQNNPGSVAAHIALSYAHQAAFKLPEALQDARTAANHAPDSGTAWARLAELQLSTGELDRGIQSARKAAALNPRIAHAHTILGFAYLTRIKTQNAREAFNQAIALDSTAPLPRLGLGLATIRDGNLEEGRAQIEIAAGLDPSNALIRSYLGKAYFDEKRGPRDEQQLEIAKGLDPKDPTPWFYDALRKQTLNRPVEALQDLQRSIELNNNRAVYRSRLLLDEDLAARSAALGRIYNDLSFQHLALTEGYKSLNADPTNYSAHRLLADSYSSKPRHEIARISELLQSQLFQPLNLTPIQAHLAESETSFSTTAGPAGISFNELNPLFTRNRFALQANGLRGNNNTWGGEATVSGIYDRVSGSISSYHTETDGFRQNNEEARDLFDLFLQGALSPKTNVQAEYRYTQREYGDLSQNFDGLYVEDKQQEHDIIAARLGAHHAFSPRFSMIGSFMKSDAVYESEQTPPLVGFPIDTRSVLDGALYEIRSDLRLRKLGLVTGFSYMNGDQEYVQNITLSPGFSVPLKDAEVDFFKENLYAYSNLQLPGNTILTMGISGSSMKIGSQIDRKQFNPKLGLTVHPSMRTTLRLAFFRLLSSKFVSSQTVEPTHIAGFSQLFDDLDASDVRSYGLAIDHKFSMRLFCGFEYLRRDLDVPNYQIWLANRAEFYNWKEDTRVAYIYWAPLDVIALRVEYQYERFDHRDSPAKLGVEEVETHRIPLSVSYFHPSGFHSKIAATYFYQEGEFQATDTYAIYPDSDNFWVLDVEMAYRLPKRWGLVSLGIRNLLDEEFNYQETDTSNPAVVPGVFAYGKITLSF